MNPFSQDAERIEFSLSGISVQQDNGTLVPLSLRIRDFSGTGMKRQRLIASGRLRPGNYNGFLFDVKSAVLKLEEGEAALLLPEEPVKKQTMFHVEKGKPLVISLVFNFRDSLQSGYRFSPSFQTSRPERPLIGLTGYVTNSGSGLITVFDKKRLVVTGAIAAGNDPKGMAFDLLLNRAYVAAREDDAVVVVDIGAGEVINRIALLPGDKPQDLALTADGKTLVCVNEGSNSVSFIDPGSAFEISRITVGEGPQAIATDRTGRKGYIFNTFSNTISVIDMISRTLVSTVPTESGPFQGEFNRKGDRLYVLYSGSPYLGVMDPFSFSVVKKVYVGMQPTALKVDTNTDMLYVARKRAAEVDVYDPFSLLPVELIRAEASVDFMTIDGESNSLFLLSSQNETITAVHINSKNIISSIDVGRGPHRIRAVGER